MPAGYVLSRRIMQVRNQTYLRRKNKEEIIKLLREKSMSYSDIARTLMLSNTAIAKIADDLISDGLIVRDGEAKGRTGIELKINGDYGYVFAVDLSGKKINICAADMQSNILLRRTIPDIVHIERTDFEKVLSIMKEMTESETLAGKVLRCISIATPGKMDEEGKFILNPRFGGFGNVSLKQLTEEKFPCATVIKNDVKLALEGEKTYGSILTDVSDAIMFHIDVGTGSALMLNNKIYCGTRGFAGEIGYFRLDAFRTRDDDYGNLKYSNYFDTLSLYSVLDIVRREVSGGAKGYLTDLAGKRGVDAYGITIKDMTDAYIAGDPVTARALDSSARVLGSVAANLAEYLDIDMIVINGAAVDLGDNYLNAVRETARGKRVEYSSLMCDTTIMGAVNAGITQAFSLRL